MQTLQNSLEDFNMDYVNQLFNATIQYILTAVVCTGCAFLGIRLRQLKNKRDAAKAEQ